VIVDSIRRLGASALAKLQSIGAAGIFLWQALVAVPQPRTSFPLLIKQLYAVGVLSLPLLLFLACLLVWCWACRAITF
jgi:phospholipid/cholesterol/gamma-HCH transport system permease protein